MLRSFPMRFVLGVAAIVLSGCASSAYRIGGDPISPAGVAETPCESKEWLVIAPTRAEVASKSKGTSSPEDGLGLYRVGSNSPLSIPAIEDLTTPSVGAKRSALAPYERRQVVAAGLGVAGLIAIAVGTIVFVNAFESQTTVVNGTPTEKTSISGGTAALGGTFVGVGFGMGIAGLVVNPSHAERTRADATRYVFFDPPDDRASVEGMVKRHNEDVRRWCSQPNH
jgi:hypothetical protein